MFTTDFMSELQTQSPVSLHRPPPCSVSPHFHPQPLSPPPRQSRSPKHSVISNRNSSMMPLLVEPGMIPACKWNCTAERSVLFGRSGPTVYTVHSEPWMCSCTSCARTMAGTVGGVYITGTISFRSHAVLFRTTSQCFEFKCIKKQVVKMVLPTKEEAKKISWWETLLNHKLPHNKHFVM